MDLKTVELKIGPYQVKPLPTGLFGLDGGAMFGTVPKVLWQRSNPADDLNRIQMEARALLLQSSDRVILIDTGVGADFVEKYGEKLGPKFAEMYGVEGESGLLKSLSQYGLKAEDVTDVILTHLHFDHAGGATCFRDGKLQPTFPKAKYYVQRGNLETARQPNVRERASYLPSNFEPLMEFKALQLLDGSVENLLPNVSLQVNHGHTAWQQIVRVSDDEKSLVYCADLIPTSSHIRLAWIMGYDLQPLVLIEEKKKLLAEAAKQDWYLFFEHDPYCDCAQVDAEKSDFAVREKFRLV